MMETENEARCMDILETIEEISSELTLEEAEELLRDLRNIKKRLLFAVAQEGEIYE